MSRSSWACLALSACKVAVVSAYGVMVSTPDIVSGGPSEVPARWEQLAQLLRGLRGKEDLYSSILHFCTNIFVEFNMPDAVREDVT